MMHLKTNQYTFYLIGIIFFISCLVAPPAFSKTRKLRLQSAFSGSGTIYGETEAFTKTVKERTNGEIEITMYAPGALVKPLEIYEAVKNGVVDMALSTGLYHTAKVPVGLIEFGVPFSFATTGDRLGPEASNQLYDFEDNWRDGKVMEIYKAAYAERGTHLIGHMAISSYGFMTTFPVETLADFKGRKMRTFGLYSHLAKKMGAAPMSVSAAEQYLALQRGTVNGTIYPYYTLEDYKLKEVITHIIYPVPSPTAGCSVYVNDKVWKSLSPEHQKIMGQAFEEHKRKYTNKALEYEKKVVEDAKKLGIKEVILPDSDIAKMKEMGRSLWPAAAKKSERSAEIISLMTEYLKEKGLY